MLLQVIRPKHLMIFGVVSMLCGLCVLALWNVRSFSRWEIEGTHIIGWCRKTLGRYGCSGFYFAGGLLLFLRGYFGMRVEERQKQQQPYNPFQPPRY